MTTLPPAQWTAEEVAAYAKRFGLSLSDPMMARLLELANIASTAGNTMPRQPSKANEPAYGFHVHHLK